MKRRIIGAVAASLAAVLALSACATPAVTHTQVEVVASTNVYGNIAKVIGGSYVKVTSVIDDGAQDPHSFEGSARVQLDLSTADVVIENGGGYDSFMDTLMAGLATEPADVINVAQLSRKPITSEFNEHLWYDFPTMERLAASLVGAFSEKSPSHTADFQNNASIFVLALANLESREGDIKARFGGTGVAITEPVPGYMLEASGLTVVTPAKLIESVEADTDVAPSVLRDAVEQFQDGTARILVFNAQTTGAQTDEMRHAAAVAQVPAMSVTETLPTGYTYLTWMTSNLALLKLTLASQVSVP